MGMPLWAVALVVAAAAPLVVRHVADAMERAARERTEAALGRANAAERAAGTEAAASKADPHGD